MHWNVDATTELYRLRTNYEASIKLAAEAIAAKAGRPRVGKHCVGLAVEMLAFTDLQRRVKALEAEIAKLKPNSRDAAGE